MNSCDRFIDSSPIPRTVPYFKFENMSTCEHTLLIISILHSSHAMHATEADTWHSGDGRHAHSRCHRTLTTSALTEMCNVVDKSVRVSIKQLAARVIPLSAAAAAIDARPDTETSSIPLRLSALDDHMARRSLLRAMWQHLSDSRPWQSD
jgi:hypothetical protein